MATKFWQADAILHSLDHSSYGQGTFLLPSRSPRRARLAYKIVLGASAGLFWVFKRETYPYEHVIPRNLQANCLAMNKHSAQALTEAAQKPREKTDDTITEVSPEGEPHNSRVSEAREVIVETILEIPYDDSSRCESELLIDTALTSISPRHNHGFPVSEVSPEDLSHHLLALHLRGEKKVHKPLQDLDWLNLAFSKRQENAWPHDIFSCEDSQVGVSCESLVIEDVANSSMARDLPQPMEQKPSPVVEAEWEEIDLDAAFGMGATDLEDDDDQDDVTVIMSKITKDSPSPELISKLEQDRQALFVGARGQAPQQKPRLQQYIQGDFTAEASEDFANLPKERWDAAGWAYAIGTIKYYYWHAAHKYCSDKGYYQHPRLEESERSWNWSAESKAKEAQRPSCPRISLTEQPPSPNLDEAVVTNPYHHENYLMHPVVGKTSTSPETSLWLAHFAYRRKAIFDPITRQGVLASQATKTVDPYQYIGPQEYLQKYTGTRLQNAILGYVNRIYTPRGSWQLWEYEDEAVPVLPSDVEWFNNAEQGYEGMQLPYFMNPNESRDMVVNGDCGIHGPPRRAFPFGEKAKSYFCGSPLRYELSNPSIPQNEKAKTESFVAQMPSIAEEDEDEDTEPTLAVTHKPSTAEDVDDRPAEPAEVSLVAISEEGSPVEQPAESEQSDFLDGFSEEDIALENDDFYGSSLTAPKDEGIQVQRPDLDGVSPTSDTESEDFVLCDEEIDEDEAPTTVESEHGAQSPIHDVHQPIVSLEFDEDTPLNEIEAEGSPGRDGDPDHALNPSEEFPEEESMQWADISLNSEESPLAPPTLEIDQETYEDLTDYTNSWTKPVGTSKNPRAAYLAKFSDNYVNQPPENGDKSKEEYLAQWFEGVSKTSGKRGLHGEISQADYLRVFCNDPQNAVLSTYWCEVFAANDDVDDDMPVDITLNNGNDGNSDPTSRGLAGCEAQSGPYTPEDLDSSSEGVSPPPNGDESAATTQDHKFDVDQEISRVERRLRELYDIKYAAQYTSLDQFDLETAAKERMPLFPMVGIKTPPQASIITGILLEAAQHSELDKYMSELTDAMASKDLRVQSREESKPGPVIFNPNDLEDSEEAPVPNAFDIGHPDMLFKIEAVRIAEALKMAQAPTVAEMEAAAEVGELQDLEDNAAINGGHMFFEPINADVPWRADVEAASSVRVETPIINEELEAVTIQRPTQGDPAEVVPVSPYVHYSDMLELQSALEYNEYLYGTLNIGIAKKVKKLTAKLKFWGKVESGKK